MRTLTHVSVSPTIVTGRLHERGGRGDGEPTIYIIVASSLGTHTFVFIGRRRGGKATDGIFGPVRPEILRWEDRISFYFAFTSFSSPSRHHFLAFLRRFFYHFSSRRYQEIHRARPQHPRHGFGNQGEWVTNVQQVDTRAPLCTRTLGDLKFRSIRRDTLSLSPPPSLFLSPSLSPPIPVVAMGLARCSRRDGYLRTRPANSILSPWSSLYLEYLQGYHVPTTFPDQTHVSRIQIA